MKELELAFEESEIATLFGKFKKLADKKHEITDADIRALVAGTAIENPEGFHFGDLKLTSNADDTVTAEVLMVNADGEEVEVIANGKVLLKLSITLSINSSIKLSAFSATQWML